MSPTAQALTFTPVDQTGFGPEAGNCLAACAAMLTGIPIDVVTRDIGAGNGEDEVEHWWIRFERVMRGYGYDVEYWYTPCRIPTGYAIMGGISPRGLSHATIACNGRLVHDPHPSRAGIGEPTHFIVVTPR